MAFGGSGSGFGNPPVGNQGTIERIQFQSANYVPGVSGWAIFRNGNVEFNSGVFRGTVTAGTFEGSDFVINPDGIFFYSGTAAFGNLIYSVASAPGTDTFGNPYEGPGPFAYGGPGLPSVGMSSSFDGNPGFYLLSNRPAEIFPAAMLSFIANQGLANEILGVAYNGPNVANPNAQSVFVQLFSSAEDGSITAEGTLCYADGNGNVYDVAIWGKGGIYLNTIEQAFAQDPTVSNKPQAEVWKAFNPLSAGYNVAGAGNYAEYQMGLDGRTTRLAAFISVTNGPGVTFAQLNATALVSAYRPKNKDTFFDVSFNEASVFAGANNAHGIGKLTTGGLIFVYGGAVAATSLAIRADVPLDLT